MNYATQSVDQFLSDVASADVTPAGGTVAAVVGASGAALCEMVCIHTGERDGTGDTTGLTAVRDDLRHLRERLLVLADSDADAVDELLTTHHEGHVGTEAKQAAGVPLAIAEACLSVLEHATTVTERGTPNAVPDAVTGAALAHGALRACLFTVRCNTDRIDDPSFVAEMDRRTADVERAAEDAYERVGENARDHR